MVDSVSSSVSAASSLVSVERVPLRSRQAETLTPEQQRQVDALKEVDAKVHRHEQAHLSVGRDLVIGGASYTYTTGPDKRRYAVAGEVTIDTSPARTAEETIPKAQHIRATALAPVDPSAQDHSVASVADRMEAKARLELQGQPSEAVAEGAASASVSSRYSEMQGAEQDETLGTGLDLFA